jgi:glycogen synthase
MTSTNDNVFMIGWEYPPHNSGGLGVACHGLTKAMSDQKMVIHFSLPYQTDHVNHMNIVNCAHPNWEHNCHKNQNCPHDVGINESCNECEPCGCSQCNCNHSGPPFLAYTPEFYSQYGSDDIKSELYYQKKLQEENSGYSFDITNLRHIPTTQLEKQVNEYAQTVGETGQKYQDNFDVIHAHDWMTFPAAQELKRKTGKPLIAHVHSTEFDRAGLNMGNHYIANIEYVGMHQADHVIAVSWYTKRLLEAKYGVDPKKVSVVHNGISSLESPTDPGRHHFASKRPVIVFMGRLTLQKGVSYFLDLAAQVLKKIPDALFVVAGSGDMYHELLFRTSNSQLSASVVFSGFVRDKQRDKLLDRADVFVMPSISEPFGLVAMEAAQRHTPVIISKNSGVAEVLPSAIALDFWDLQKMSEAISEIVSSEQHLQKIVTGQLKDISQQTWHLSAQKIRDIYRNTFLGR